MLRILAMDKYVMCVLVTGISVMAILVIFVFVDVGNEHVGHIVDRHVWYVGHIGDEQV